MCINVTFLHFVMYLVYHIYRRRRFRYAKENHYLFFVLCFHNPNNWGAFSNYYHDYKYHWSSVTRARDSKSSYAYAPSHQTSRAFINRNFGETVYFNYGFKKIHSS